MAVATSLGCRTVRVIGIAVDDEQMVTFSPTAIDFGTVPVGGRSDPRRVTILHQFAPGMRSSIIRGFGLVPGEEFELTPLATVEDGECSTMQLEVTYRPVRPGVVDGGLLWTVTTGNLEGIMNLQLYGTGVDSN